MLAALPIALWKKQSKTHIPKCFNQHNALLTTKDILMDNERANNENTNSQTMPADFYKVGDFVRVRACPLIQYIDCIARISKQREWRSGTQYKFYVYELDLTYEVGGVERNVYSLEEMLEPYGQSRLNKLVSWDKCAWRPTEIS
jgi:hypothetical protein